MIPVREDRRVQGAREERSHALDIQWKTLCYWCLALYLILHTELDCAVVELDA